MDGGGSVTTAFNGFQSLAKPALHSDHNIHQTLVTFPGLRLKDVRELRFQTRSYQWVPSF